LLVDWTVVPGAPPSFLSYLEAWPSRDARRLAAGPVTVRLKADTTNDAYRRSA